MWADQLSRGDLSGFDPKWRFRVKIGEALEAPWQQVSVGAR